MYFHFWQEFNLPSFSKGKEHNIRNNGATQNFSKDPTEVYLRAGLYNLWVIVTTWNTWSCVSKFLICCILAQIKWDFSYLSKRIQICDNFVYETKFHCGNKLYTNFFETHDWGISSVSRGSRSDKTNQTKASGYVLMWLLTFMDLSSK